MIQAPDLPPWASLLVAILVAHGSDHYSDRRDWAAPAQDILRAGPCANSGHDAGHALIILASMACFTVMQSRPLLHELLILGFVTVTTPITLMLLVRRRFTVTAPRATTRPADGWTVRAARMKGPYDGRGKLARTHDAGGLLPFNALT